MCSGYIECWQPKLCKKYSMFDLLQVLRMLDDELMNAYRNNDRLRTKNGVIITQRNKLMQQIKMHMAETEVILLNTIKIKTHK